jgi:dCMP deaminase
MQTKLLVYLPVLHEGYDKLFQRYSLAEILILGRSFVTEFPTMGKDIRALVPERAADYVRSLHLGLVRVVEAHDLPPALACDILVVPDETLMYEILSSYGPPSGTKIVFEETFLRWNRKNIETDFRPDADMIVSASDPTSRWMILAEDEGQRTSDWWRSVGAVAVRNGEMLATSHNVHLPTEYSPYVDGDPRSEFGAGERLDLSTALHAEANLIASAAKTGLRLKGADLFVSTFPCPGCARLIAKAGFSRLFFNGGYSVLSGAEVLRVANVTLIHVKTDPET